MAIRAQMGDPWRRNADRTDQPSMTTVTVEMEVLTSAARAGLDLLVRTADEFCHRTAEELPF